MRYDVRKGGSTLLGQVEVFRLGMLFTRDIFYDFRTP